MHDRFGNIPDAGVLAAIAIISLTLGLDATVTRMIVARLISITKLMFARGLAF